MTPSSDDISFHDLIDTVRSSLVVLDQDLRVTSAKRAPALHFCIDIAPDAVTEADALRCPPVAPSDCRQGFDLLLDRTGMG